MNAEKIIADYLRAEDLRVVVQTPRDTSTPWIRLTQLGAPKRTRGPYLYEIMAQLDCYAGVDGGQPEATDLAWTARNLFEVIELSDHEGVVVTASRNVGHLRRPDEDFEPARERVILTQLVWMHPEG